MTLPENLKKLRTKFYKLLNLVPSPRKVSKQVIRSLKCKKNEKYQTCCHFSFFRSIRGTTDYDRKIVWRGLNHVGEIRDEIINAEINSTIIFFRKN